MKEVKAYVHRARAADIIQALESAGFKNLTASDVQGLLEAVSAKEQGYSIELSERVISQVKLEVFCEDTQAERAALIIRTVGRTGQRLAGWVYESTVDRVWAIDQTEAV